MPAKKTAVLTPPRQLALDALQTAHGYADAKIREEGHNLGDQVLFFQKMAKIKPGDPWCCAFVYTSFAKSWMWRQGLLTGTDAQGHENRAIMQAHADAFSSAAGIVRTGYCPTLFQYFHEKGLTVGRQDVYRFNPSPGDIVLYDFLNQGEPHHVGIVLQTAGSSGEILSVEGNTSSGVYGSQADGDGCFVRARYRDHIFAFVSWK